MYLVTFFGRFGAQASQSFRLVGRFEWSSGVSPLLRDLSIEFLYSIPRLQVRNALERIPPAFSPRHFNHATTIRLCQAFPLAAALPKRFFSLGDRLVEIRLDG